VTGDTLCSNYHSRSIGVKYKPLALPPILLFCFVMWRMHFVLPILIWCVESGPTQHRDARRTTSTSLLPKALHQSGIDFVSQVRATMPRTIFLIIPRIHVHLYTGRI
jgi:hypothetical protein